MTAAPAGIALASALPLGVLAVLRARVVGDDLRGFAKLTLILVTLVATAAYAQVQPVAAVVLAYAATCAWTDLRARRVYLPVSLAAASVVVVLQAAAGSGPAAALGGLALGAFGLGLHVGTRRRGFGFGDATNWAIIGAGLGLERSLWAVAVGATFGAVAVVPLIGLGLIGRSYRVPMALCTFAGTVAVLCMSSAGIVP